MKGSSSKQKQILIGLMMVLPWCTGSRPDPEDAAIFARWMVSQGSWGVLSTLDRSNEPFGNVVSYSDAGAGIPYFYLTTTLDPTGSNALHNSRSSFTLSESLFGYCNASTDPQSPICAKITLSGNLKLLGKKSKEATVAEAALFSSHPQLAVDAFGDISGMVKLPSTSTKSTAPPRDLKKRKMEERAEISVRKQAKTIDARSSALAPSKSKEKEVVVARTTSQVLRSVPLREEVFRSKMVSGYSSW